MKKLVLGFVLVLALAACDQAQTGFDDIKIIEATIGGQKLYIPDVYLKFGYTSLDNKSGLIQAYYPGSAPVPDDPTKLWEQGEWYKNVRILFNNPPKSNPKAVFIGVIESQKTDLDLGKEYSLRHLTQSNEKNSYKRDIWVENEKEGSFIACTDKTSEDDPAQMCGHKFYLGKVNFQVSYDKKLMPHWKEIKNNVLDLYESFKSPETALAYVQQFYPETAQEGETP